MTRILAPLLLVCVSVSAPGCFAPQYQSGHLRCQTGAHPCPDGLSCIAGTCWRNGTAPPLQLQSLATSGGGGVATSERGAQLSLSACELPIGGVVQSERGATLAFGFLASSEQ
jgi:hypothetical protein